MHVFPNPVTIMHAYEAAYMVATVYYTDNSKLTLEELCKKVTPNFASYWWRIGVFLKFRHGELERIESEFRNYQERCDKMLAKWLDVDTSASWEKLKYSIQLAIEDRTGKLLL